MKSPSEIARDIRYKINIGYLKTEEEVDRHIEQAITTERQRQERLVDEIKTLKRHWIEDDRDLNDLIAQNEKLVEALKEIERIGVKEFFPNATHIAQQVLKEVK